MTIVNGGVAVTVPITAAVVPLLVSVTFLGLLVPVASTLPKLSVSGATSSLLGSGVGVLLGVAPRNAGMKVATSGVPHPLARSNPATASKPVTPLKSLLPI